MRARKVFAGRKIRNPHRTQTLHRRKDRPSADPGRPSRQKLGISTSYLNQLENNQRHVTAPVLLALAEVFSVDIKDPVRQRGRPAAGRCVRGAGRSGFRRTAAGAGPEAGGAEHARLCACVSVDAPGLRRAGEQLAELDDTLERSGAQTDPTPYEEVRDFFHYIDNYIDWLDRAGEDAEPASWTAAAPSAQGAGRVHRGRHGVRTVIGGREAGRRAGPGALAAPLRPVIRVLSLNPRSPVGDARLPDRLPDGPDRP
jgi:transcriptional regulator with XRE-family HTH domain